MQHHSWAMMVVISESAVFGPDAMEAIRGIAHSQMETMGRIATAWVVAPDVEGASFMPSVIESLYGGSDRIQIFETRSSAESWLHGRLAQ